MTLLALVEPGMAASAQFRAFEPLAHEQRAFDPLQLLECEVELVLAAVGREFSQHDGRRHDAGLQRRGHAEGLTPVLADESISAAGRVRRRAGPAIRPPLLAGPARPRSPSPPPGAIGNCRSAGSSMTLQPRHHRSAACRVMRRKRRFHRAAGWPILARNQPLPILLEGHWRVAGISRLPDWLRSRNRRIAESVGS